MRPSSLFRGVAVLVCLHGVVGAQAPANDEPAGAVALGDGINPGAPAGAFGSVYTNVGATNSAGYAAVCGGTNNSDVFFSYSAATTGVYIFALCTPAGFGAGTMGDGVLNVYDAAAPTVSLACDDNACVVNSPGNASNLPQAAVSLASGGTFLVRVSSAGLNPPGDFYVSVIPPTVQGGATCATSVLIGDGVHGGNTFGATASGAFYGGCALFTAATLDLFYEYVPVSNGALVFHREAGGAGRLAIITGACGTPTLVPFTCISSSYLIVSVTAGTTYRLRIGPTSPPATALAGAFLFSLRLVPASTNDTCATATTAAAGSNFGTTTGMTQEGSVPACAGFTVGSALDSWYAFTPASNGQLDLKVLGVLAPQVAVYPSGTCASLATAMCVANTVNGALATFSATSGQTMYVRVGQPTGSNAGVFDVRIVFFPAPTNDDCPGATAIVSGANGPFTNAGASDGGVVSSCSAMFRDVWHSWTAPHNGRARIDLCGSIGNTVLAVYASCGGSEIACDDDDLANGGPCAITEPLASYVEFDAAAGATYRIRVGGKTSAPLTYAIKVDYKFSLSVASNVPGQTVRLTNVGGTPGSVVFNALTFNAGVYPNGWLYGVDIPLNEFFVLAAFGQPFVVNLDGSGVYDVLYTSVALPFNVNVYFVGVELTAGGLVARTTRHGFSAL